MIFWDFETMKIEEIREWERLHSSLIRLKNADYEQCRAYSCKSITDGLTKIDIKKGEIFEIPQGVPFHFIGRVDTSSKKNTPESYYQDFIEREFISYTTICNQNVSHFKGDIFFLYNIYPRDIAHVFPMDSNTKKNAENEYDLTLLPSLWITLSELEELSKEIGAYNQVTVKTKRDGCIIKPFAVAAFEHVDETIKKVAELFDIGIVLLHPDSNAINYTGDILYDYFKLKDASKVIKRVCGFPVEEMYYFD